MKKIIISMLLLVLAFNTAIGQAEQDAVFTMKQELLTAESILNNMGNGIKKDKHKDMETQIHEFDNSIKKIEGQTSPLQSQYKNGLSDKISDLRATFSSFEKLVHKSKLFDKDKELKSEFETLNTKLIAVKDYLLYIQVELDKAEDERLRQEAIVEQQNQQAIQNQQNDQAASNNANTESIASLKTKLAEIEVQITKVAATLKKGIYKDVVEHAGNIITLSSKMQTATGNLTSNKSTISSIVNSIKTRGIELETLGKGGHHKDDKIHHELDAIKKDVEQLKANLN